MMKRLLFPLLTGAALVMSGNLAHSQEATTGANPEASIAPSAEAQPAAATSQAQAPIPRSVNSSFRLVPVGGASSFNPGTEFKGNRFDEGFTAGLFADFGPGTWVFETGIEALNTRTAQAGRTENINVTSWGIPLLAKVNFSGKPHETVFAKAGVMPFRMNGDIHDTDVMAVGGLGAAIPLGHYSAFIIDATYNYNLTTGGDLAEYQGISLLGGFSFNL